MFLFHLTVFFGCIADYIPTRRTPFVLGLVLSFASTICFALGTTLPVLLSARLLEGLSAAIVATVGYALISDVVEQDRLGRAMGFTNMSMSMALLLGPVLGGVLYEYCGYFKTFLPALVLLGIEVGLRGLIVEGGKRGRRSLVIDAREDGDKGTGDEESAETGTGTETGTDASTTSTLAHDRSPRTTPQDPPTGAVESQPLLLPPPPTHPTRNAHLILLTNPRFLVSITGLFALNSTACGFDAVTAPYISSTFGLAPVHAAALFLALAIPMLFSPFTGALTDRFGAKVVASTGLAVGAPALTALSLVPAGAAQPMAKLMALFFVVGVALALSLVPLRVDAAAVVEDIETRRPGIFGPHGAYGRAFGLVNGMTAAGGLVGPLAAGYLRMWIGWTGMAWSMGGLSLLVLGFVIVFTGGKVGGTGRSMREER